MNTDDTNDFISQRLEIECLTEELEVLSAYVRRLYDAEVEDLMYPSIWEESPIPLSTAPSKP